VIGTYSFWFRRFESQDRDEDGCIEDDCSTIHLYTALTWRAKGIRGAITFSNLSRFLKLRLADWPSLFQMWIAWLSIAVAVESVLMATYCVMISGTVVMDRTNLTAISLVLGLVAKVIQI